MVDDSIKFAWAYLLLRGIVTNGKWNYYASSWEGKDGCFIRHPDPKLEKVRKEVLKVGVDWTKSGIPTVTKEWCFDDSFSDGHIELATLGKLVLNNGKTYLIGSSNEDAAHLARTAMEIMKGKHSDVLELAEAL